MTFIDVFNGDADGICALIQLRKASPQTAQLVTGVKRDINLLKRVDATAGDHISVLDISFDKNRSDVQRLLNQGATIEYFDHHYQGPPINHRGLKTAINDQLSHPVHRTDRRSTYRRAVSRLGAGCRIWRQHECRGHIARQGFGARSHIAIYPATTRHVHQLQ